MGSLVFSNEAVSSSEKSLSFVSILIVGSASVFDKIDFVVVSFLDSFVV